jgi:hypothetical protein
VTTNAFEIADFVAMHKQKLQQGPIPRPTVTFTQHWAAPRLRFAKPRLDS